MKDFSRRMWAHPSFIKKLKKEAAERGISMINLTKILGKNPEDILKKIRKDEEQPFKFKF